MVEVELSRINEALTVKHPYLGALIVIVGLLKLGSIFRSLFAVIRSTLLVRGNRLSPYRLKGGKPTWAVVTGPTAGIGEQFAHQIAAAKFNVALVGRNQEKLDTVAKELESKYNVETASFILDAATATEEEYQSLAKFVADLGSVTVLVNNLGISHDMPVPFNKMDDEEMRRIVQVNCVATIEITKAVLPTIENTAGPKSNKGLILTMGSFAGLTPAPLLSVYSGSKMFLQGWSSALGAELKASNIDVQLIISYLVTSKLSKVRKTSLLIPSPKGFVKSVLRQLGRNGGAQERAFTMTPYWSHALMHWVIESTLGVYSGIVSKINLGMHADIRKRALRKKNKAN
ncbi:ketoreductase [Starmerella bacillaris]|uniref:Very-long-chain 3-oxoacyl-CoA reductase n=1 Tax=Starmerella bacillaris TaxID=1247836 RepID=A0AAV5RGQ6_STABA|nr:ketoreductase [Starmerella bacillaris]